MSFELLRRRAAWRDHNSHRRLRRGVGFGRPHAADGGVWRLEPGDHRHRVGFAVEDQGRRCHQHRPGQRPAGEHHQSRRQCQRRGSGSRPDDHEAARESNQVHGIVGTFGELVPGLQAGRWDMIGGVISRDQSSACRCPVHRSLPVQWHRDCLVPKRCAPGPDQHRRRREARSDRGLRTAARPT